MQLVVGYYFNGIENKNKAALIQVISFLNYVYFVTNRLELYSIWK